jgi:muramidase (phage lysozyme)
MQLANQLKAFRDVLAYSEGTDRPDRQPSNFDGYDVIVGGELCMCFDHHPRKLVRLPRYGISSTAAGRYQFIIATWKALVKQLNLPDFTPASQDRACDELLRQCGAADELAKGHFDRACQKANAIWASLPGSPYGQRTENLATLRAIFVAKGGIIQ